MHDDAQLVAGRSRNYHPQLDAGKLSSTEDQLLHNV